MVSILRGSLSGQGLVIGIVQARFNADHTDALLATALVGLEALGVSQDDIEVITVPGAVEIPLAVRHLGDSGRFDAIIALGAVIRGETSHYDTVCQMVADGCMRVSLDLDLPVLFGVLTTEDDAQAEARVDKGRECAEGAIEMANFLRGRFA